MIAQSAQLRSELLAVHPSLHVAPGLRFRNAGAALNQGAELRLVLDGRQVGVGQEAPSLLGLFPVAEFPRNSVGPLAALKSEHDLSLRAGAEGSGEQGCDSPGTR